jgi:predicted nuclease with TOPRIM domain
LLESLTPVNKQYVDKKIVALGQEKEALEARLRELESMQQQEVDCDALADEIMAAVNGFNGLFEHGRMQERKEFIGLFVEKIELDPDKRVGKFYMCLFRNR